MLIIVGLLLLVFNSGGYCVGRSSLYTVYPQTAAQIQTINNLEVKLAGVDIWQHVHQDRDGRVQVSKHLQPAFEAKLNSEKIPFDVLIEDVESAVFREKQLNGRFKSLSQSQNKINFEAYHKKTFISKVTTEGRDLKAIVMSITGGSDARKPVIIVEAGIHAREWIAPAMALYMITKLLENVTEIDLANDIDWVIVPVLNPDGYEFSHETYRMWRKTRSETPVAKCVGVDGNRNFDFQWMTVGASDNPCDETYAGPKPFSEPETRFLRDILAKYKGRTRAHLAIHSFGSYVMYPYGYNTSPTPDDAEIQSVGKQMGAAIDKASLPGSKKYIVGNSGAVIYKVGGGSHDYAYAKGGARLAYTVELPGPGFDLPPSKIAQTVRETWQGIVVLGRHVLATS